MTITGKQLNRVRLNLSDRDGMTLLELMIAATVFVIAVVGLMYALIISTQLTDINRQDTLALQAAQQVIESMLAEDFSEVYQKYNQTTADNPNGNLDPDHQFSINDQLVAPAGAIDSPTAYQWNENNNTWDGPGGNPVFQGRIIFPNMDPGNPQLLTENVTLTGVVQNARQATDDPVFLSEQLQTSLERLRLDAASGYMEINGNGAMNTGINPALPADPSFPVRQLPVIVYIEWRDPAGGRVATVLETILANR